MAGRYPLYSSVKKMQKKIDEYFSLCAGIIAKNEDGKPIISDKGVPFYEIPPKPPTITGLALHLGLSSRQALLNYQGKDEFNDTVTRAKLRVEAYAEERLFDKDGVQGAKFSLANNFSNWNDKGDKGTSDIEDLTIIAEMLTKRKVKDGE